MSSQTLNFCLDICPLIFFWWNIILKILIIILDDNKNETGELKIKDHKLY